MLDGSRWQVNHFTSGTFDNIQIPAPHHRSIARRGICNPWTEGLHPRCVEPLSQLFACSGTERTAVPSQRMLQYVRALFDPAIREEIP